MKERLKSPEFKREIKADEIETTGTEKNWLEQLKEKFNQFFSKEEKEKRFPKIEIDIFYSPHATDKDIDGLEKQFSQADVYIPELADYSSATLKNLNKLSQEGRYRKGFLGSLDNFGIEERFLKKQLEMISYSKKPITLIDLPGGHYLINALDKSFEPFKLPDDFKSALELIKSKLKKMSELEKEREDYMISQIRPKVEKVLKNYPQLSKKENIKVLISLGAVHTKVYHSLKKTEREKVQRKFSRLPFIFSLEEEAMRKYGFGKEVDDELAAKVVLEGQFRSIFKDYLYEICDDNLKIGELTRKIISQFSFNEIEEMFNSLKKDPNLTFESLFKTKFKEKGIKLPSNEAELDKMIGKE